MAVVALRAPTRIAFSEILEPGLTAYARDMYLTLDGIASSLADAIRKTHGTPAELRAYADDLEKRECIWLAGQNRQLADWIEEDARLAAIPQMYALASTDSLGRIEKIWVNFYAVELRKHIDACKAAPTQREPVGA